MEIIIRTLAGLTKYLDQIINFLEGVIGVDPVLIIPVFVLVWIGRRVFSPVFEYFFGEQFVEDYRKSGISIVIILASTFLVWIFGSCGDKYTVLRCGVVLGSVSALSYQIFKPVVKKAVKRVPKILISKMGLKNEEVSE